MLSRLLSWLSLLLSRALSIPSIFESSGTSPSEPQSSHGSLNSQSWIDSDTFQRAAGIGNRQAERWYSHVRAACLEHDITTPERIAAWIAQVGHESGGFVYTREIWGPTPAQLRYESRADLGNTQPGDGSRYRGRGLIQITGRYNYTRAARALGVDVVTHPELLESDGLAARSAAWWWEAHGCNELADAGDFVALTRRINGGTNGLADRQRRHEVALSAMEDATWS